MSLLGPIAIKVLIGLAIAGLVTAVVLGLIGKGKALEKAEQIERNFKVRKVQDAIEAGDPDDIERFFDGV